MKAINKPHIQANIKHISSPFLKFPWLWVDQVVARLPVPDWLLSIALFVFLCIVSFVVSLLAGESLQYQWDIRRLIIFALPAFASYTMSFARRTMTQLEKNLAPWIASPENEVKDFWANTPRWLMRGFWIFAIIWILIIPLLYFIMNRIIIGVPHAPGTVPNHPRMMANIAFVMSPIVAYFMGGATSIAVVGLGSVVHHLSHSLDLKEGFILKGAKGVLQPFNRLFWMTWSTVALPLLLIGVVAVTLNYVTAQTTIPLRLFDIIPLALALIIFVLTVIIPQIYMNSFLQKEKRDAMKDIQEQIDKAIRLPSEASQEEILKHMHNLQSLSYLENKVEKFNPTMVDAKFILQIAAVLITIMSAAITIRTFLNLFIK